MSVEGAFVWHDLMTTDLAAAQAFYAAVIGWSAQDSGLADGYVLFRLGERPVTGLMPLPEELRRQGVPPCWTGYVAVDDVDATALAVAADGAEVREAPRDIPGVGRFAVIADPQGAVFCLFRGEGQMAALPPPGEPGHVGWNELTTTDVEAAFAFYARHFGWGKGEAIPMGEMGVYQLLTREGAPIGGMMRRPSQAPMSYWGFYFNVADIKAAAGKVQASGGTLLRGPMEVPGGGFVAQCRDPQGGFFAVSAPV